MVTLYISVALNYKGSFQTWSLEHVRTVAPEHFLSTMESWRAVAVKTETRNTLILTLLFSVPGWLIRVNNIVTQNINDE